MKIETFFRPAVFLAGGLLFCFTLLSATPSYQVTDLGTLGGSDSVAFAINASGEITGGSTTSSNTYHAFLYSHGTMADLGTLGGPASQGQAINSAGEVVGYAQLPPSPNEGAYHPGPVNLYSAFSNDAGVSKAVGQPKGTGYAINDAGEVVAEQPDGVYVFSNGNPTKLGSLGGSSESTEANGINSSGDVVGFSYLADGTSRGFVWSAGAMTALGTLGGNASQAFAINNAGQITGTARTPGNQATHAFLCTKGSPLTDLGSLGQFYSAGTAINNSGVVVGYAQVPDPSENTVYHAFVYTGSRMVDLNTVIPASAGWVLTQANGINDSGEIVGYGTVNGQQHAFLLTPR